MDSQEKVDAEKIYKIIKGAENVEKALIDISTKRKHRERMKIRHAYKAMFGQDLMKDLKSEFTGNFRTTMLALFTDPIEYDADSLYKAIKGGGTDEDTLIEIIASRPGWYLNKIKKIYKEKYNKDLEEHVRGDTSGDFKKLLVSLLQCNRSTNQNPDIAECEKIAKELYEAGEKKLGTDEPVFNKVFALSSPHELMIISKEYHKLSKKLLTKAIDSEFSGNIKKLLKTILYVQISPSEYFATRIHEAITGVGTNEKILSRILITRTEIDLPRIKQYYKELYNIDMIEDIKDDVSGDYKELLIAIYNQF